MSYDIFKKLKMNESGFDCVHASSNVFDRKGHYRFNESRGEWGKQTKEYISKHGFLAYKIEFVMESIQGGNKFYQKQWKDLIELVRPFSNEAYNYTPFYDKDTKEFKQKEWEDNKQRIIDDMVKNWKTISKGQKCYCLLDGQFCNDKYFVFNRDKAKIFRTIDVAKKWLGSKSDRYSKKIFIIETSEVIDYIPA